MSGTLVVAILALTVSSSTLTWQIVQFALGSSRVSAELRYGAHNGAAAMTIPVGESAPDFAQLTSQGWTEPVLAVQLRNRGRLAVSVTNWAIRFDNGSTFTLPDWSVNSDAALPYRLEPGAEQTWLCPLDQIMAAAEVFEASSKQATEVRARAALGNGKIATNKNRFGSAEAAKTDLAPGYGGLSAGAGRGAASSRTPSHLCAIVLRERNGIGQSNQALRLPCAHVR